MSILTLAKSNLLSPPFSASGSACSGARIKSDLKLPTPLPTLLSTYLLLAIGLKGGTALAKADAAELALPAVATVAIGCLIPVVSFFVLQRIARMPTTAAAAMAAFYGSVSAVTFTAAMTFMERGNFAVEGFMPSLSRDPGGPRNHRGAPARSTVQRELSGLGVGVPPCSAR